MISQNRSNSVIYTNFMGEKVSWGNKDVDQQKDTENEACEQQGILMKMET